MLVDAVSSLVYPPFCLQCEAEGFWVCPGCLETLERSLVPQSEVPEELASLVCFGPYVQPLWRQLLTKYKYETGRCLLPILTWIVEQARDQMVPPLSVLWRDVVSIAPVPTDEAHVRERGFDHTSLLAEVIHGVVLPRATVVQPLIRVRPTEANASLIHKTSRALNVQGVFAPIQPLSGSVLLVDDVFTTGATCLEAAKALRRAGAVEVHVCTFARG